MTRFQKELKNLKINKSNHKINNKYFMKKLISLIVITIILSGNLFSQQCLNDIYYTVMNQNAPGKAKNMMDKKCMPGNEGSADAWLMKANVYLRYFDYELNLKKQNPNYKIKSPEILIEVVEAFRKALEINPNVQPKSGLLGALQGQKVCASDIHNIGVKYLKEKNYDKAIELILLAQKCYLIKVDDMLPDNENVFWTYYDLSDAYFAKGDFENYKTSVKRMYASKKPIPSIYIKSYQIYLEEKDTVQCGKVIATAKKVIPDTLIEERISIATLELNYLYMTQQFDTLKAVALDLIKIVPMNESHINTILDVTEYLSNIGAFSEAEQIIDTFLAIAPNNFAMTNFKGIIYLKKSFDIDNQAEKTRLSKELSNQDKIRIQNELKVTKDNLLKESHNWFDKAYTIKNDDDENIKFLYRLKKTIFVPVDPELEAKFQSIITKSDEQ